VLALGVVVCVRERGLENLRVHERDGAYAPMLCLCDRVSQGGGGRDLRVTACVVCACVVCWEREGWTALLRHLGAWKEVV